VLWARELSSRFGASIPGVAIAVSAFLLGLGLGALLTAQRRPRHALRAFAALEAGVALFALSMPSIWNAAGPALDSLAPAIPIGAWHLLESLVAGALLTLPATALGAGFPLLLQAAQERPRPLGAIYGINTLGAALGALASLVLLEQIGWSGALQVSAGAGLAAAALAFLLSTIPHAAPARGAAGSPREGGALPAMVSYAFVGAASVALEIAWTRLFGVVLLRTEYVLALVLFVYLAGAGAGSLLGRFSGLQRVPSALPIGAAAGAIAGLWALPWLGARVEAMHFESLAGAMVVQGGLLALFTLPVTIALGAWLPLLERETAGATERGRGALLYAGNCLGAAAGAVLAVVLALPLVGACACVALAAWIFLAAGALPGRRRALALAAPVLLGLSLPVLTFPDPARMLPRALAGTTVLARYEDALSLQHVVREAGGDRILLTDLQRMDASSEPSAVRVQSDQARLALLLHPAPRSLLLLGLGTGSSAAGSHAFGALERTAVEISPGAIDAARVWFAPVNGEVARELHIVRDDARHFLAADAGRYDVIVGDLFHPDLAGTGGLLSLEQFRRARARLAPGGVFVQWIALNQFDTATADVVMRTFRSVFPDARLYVDAMHLALVGGGGADARSMRAALARLPPAAALEASAREGAMTWLGRYFGPVTSPEGPLQREAAPVIEFRLPRLRFEGDLALPALLAELLRRRPSSADAARALGIGADESASFESAYAAGTFVARSWLAGFSGDGARSEEYLSLAFEANPEDRWVRSALADIVFERAPQEPAPARAAQLARALELDPAHAASLRALLLLEDRPAERERLRARLHAAAPLEDGESDFALRSTR